MSFSDTGVGHFKRPGRSISEGGGMSQDRGRKDRDGRVFGQDLKIQNAAHEQHISKRFQCRPTDRIGKAEM
jgi:hypothetical protein